MLLRPLHRCRNLLEQDTVREKSMASQCSAKLVCLELYIISHACYMTIASHCERLTMFCLPAPKQDDFMASAKYSGIGQSKSTSTFPGAVITARSSRNITLTDERCNNSSRITAATPFPSQPTLPPLRSTRKPR